MYDDWSIFFKSNTKHDYLFDYEKQDGYFPFKSENANDSEKDLKNLSYLSFWGRYPEFLSKKV